MDKGINAGGQAFPVSDGQDIYPGMTLRDWFAGQALNGLLVNDPLLFHKEQDRCFWEEDAQRIYEIADVMLKAREK